MEHIYSPGPWFVKSSSIQAVDHGTKYTIARVGNTKLSAAGVAGNARLMAAAPELLETVRWLMDYAPTPADRGRCVSAILKATGGTV